jgi:phosphohistidine phosphatase
MAHNKKAVGKQADDAPYEIYLMRHGIAADLDAQGGADDAQRPLTPDGRLKLRAVAKGLQRIGVELDWIVSSPLLRAVETADVIAEELPSGAARDTSEALSPGHVSAPKVTTFLAEHPERKRVLLAGHEPSLSQLASELVGAAHTANFAFKKGGCCLIELDRVPAKTPGRLIWWLTPRLLRKLG